MILYSVPRGTCIASAMLFALLLACVLALGYSAEIIVNPGGTINLKSRDDSASSAVTAQTLVLLPPPNPGTRCSLEQTSDGVLHSNCSFSSPLVRSGGELRIGGSRYNVWGAYLPYDLPARTTPDNRCNADAQPRSGQNSWGTSSYASFDSSIGMYTGCGYAYGAMHLKTNLGCNQDDTNHPHYNQLYSFKVEGTLLHQGPFECVLSGYVHTTSLMNTNSACAYNLGGGLTSGTYCTPDDNKVAIRIDPTSASGFNYWHASTVSVSFLCFGGKDDGSGICSRVGPAFDIEKAIFSPEDTENFDATDRRP